MNELCLVFICRNNADTIGRMIDSCLPIIDRICAVDTGSEDDTVKIVESYLTKVPVHIIHEPWKNFSHNRNKMMENARMNAPANSYLLIMDTDETLQIDPSFKKEKLKVDGYLVRSHSGDIIYYRERIVSNKLDWKWEGYVHEYMISPPKAKPFEKIDNLTMVVHPKEQPFSRNIIRNYKLLMEDYKENPDNARTIFYLGETCRDLRWLDDAIDFYKKRTYMGGYQEEIYYSMLQIGIMYKWMNMMDDAKEWLYKAIEKRSSRAEAMYELALIFQQEARYDLSAMYLEKITRLPVCKDSLFVQFQIQDHLAEFQLAVSSYHAGDYDKAFDTAQKLKTRKDLPENIRVQNLKNIVFYRRKWNEKHPNKMEYVIETPNDAWDGLGDHLFISPIPKILKEVMGFKKVWVSNFMKYKTPEVKQTVWGNNPYVDGFVDEYGMIDDYRQMCHDMMRAATNSKYFTVTNRLLDLYIGNPDEYNPDGCPWVSLKQFTLLESLTDKVVFDGNWKSFNGLSESLILKWFDEHGYPDIQLKFKNSNTDVNHPASVQHGIILPQVDIVEVQDMAHYGSIIFSCKQFISVMSGGSVLAAAIRKDNIVLDSLSTRSDIYRFYNANTYYLLDKP